MNREPKVQRAVSMLMDANCRNNIINDYEKLSELLYFFQEEQQVAIINEIKNIESNEEKTRVFESIMDLYPLSENVVIAMIQEGMIITSEIVDNYDKSQIIMRCMSKFIEMLKKTNSSVPKIISEYENKISMLEEERNKNQEQIEVLIETEKKKNSLANEVSKLEEKYENLKKSYTKEALEEKKIDLNTKINAVNEIKSKFQEAQREIEEIEKELKTINNGNDNFKKSLGQLSKLVKSFPNNKEV